MGTHDRLLRCLTLYRRGLACFLKAAGLIVFLAASARAAHQDPPELKSLTFDPAWIKAPKPGAKALEVRFVDKTERLRPHQFRVYIDNGGFLIDPKAKELAVAIKDAPDGGKEYILTLRPKRVPFAGRHLLNVWVVPKHGRIMYAFREFVVGDGSLQVRKKLLGLWTARMDATEAVLKATAGLECHGKAAQVDKATRDALQKARSVAEEADEKYTRLEEVRNWSIMWERLSPAAASEFQKLASSKWKIYGLFSTPKRSIATAHNAPEQLIPLTLSDGYMSRAELTELVGNLKARVKKLLIDDYAAPDKEYTLSLRIDGKGLVTAYHTIKSSCVPRVVSIRGVVVDENGKPVAKASVCPMRSLANSSSATTAADGSFLLRDNFIYQKAWSGSLVET